MKGKAHLDRKNPVIDSSKEKQGQPGSLPLL